MRFVVPCDGPVSHLNEHLTVNIKHMFLSLSFSFFSPVSLSLSFSRLLQVLCELISIPIYVHTSLDTAPRRWMIVTVRIGKRWREGKKERKIISMKERRRGLPLVLTCLPVAAFMLLFSLHFGGLFWCLFVLFWFVSGGVGGGLWKLSTSFIS